MYQFKYRGFVGRGKRGSVALLENKTGQFFAVKLCSPTGPMECAILQAIERRVGAAGMHHLPRCVGMTENFFLTEYAGKRFLPSASLTKDLGVFKQILLALAMIHQDAVQVQHTDLKVMAHILVDPRTGCATLADFSEAGRVDRQDCGCNGTFPSFFQKKFPGVSRGINFRDITTLGLLLQETLGHHQRRKNIGEEDAKLISQTEHVVRNMRYGTSSGLPHSMDRNMRYNITSIPHSMDLLKSKLFCDLPTGCARDA
jgi:hypothetical protein